MDTLAVNSVEFHGIVNPKAIEKIREDLPPFSHEFTFGKSYLLDAKEGNGGWALSRIIGGLLEPARGTITLNNLPYPRAQRQRDVWCVGRSQIRRFRFRDETVSWQIRHGLRTNTDLAFPSEREIMERFQLSRERYNRPLKHLSNEGWRASCAIGYVHAKEIFCFPFMPYKFIDSFHRWWLKDIFRFLADSGILLLFPAESTDDLAELFDEVVAI